MTTRKRQHQTNTTSNDQQKQQQQPPIVRSEGVRTRSARKKEKLEAALKSETNSNNSDDVIDLYPIPTGNTKKKRQRHFQYGSRDLPNEIVSSIIGHLCKEQQTLHQCTLVSKQFYTIANPLLWKAPVLIGNGISHRFSTCLSGLTSQQHKKQLLLLRQEQQQQQKEKILQQIQQRQQQRQKTVGHYVRELHLTYSYWTDNQLARLLPHTPLLNHLNLTAPNITDTSLRFIPQYCQHLTSLKLGHIHLTQVSFDVIGQNCHNLLQLEWIIWNRQSPDWLASVLPCPLERLFLVADRVSLNESLMTIIQRFNRLTCIDIAAMTTSGHMKSLLLSPTTTSLWPQLTIISLNPCDDLDDTTLIGFIKTHPLLEKIELVYVKKSTDAVLDALCGLDHLTHLTLTHSDAISHQGVCRFIQNSPSNLVSFKLEYCHFIQAQHFPDSAPTPRDRLVNWDQKAIAKIKAEPNNNN